MSPESSPPHPSWRDAEPDFQCLVAHDGDTARLRTVGELDMATAPVLSAHIAELRETGCRHVTVDLSDLRFIDACGLRVLLQCYAEARQNGFTMTVVPGPRPVQRLFELTGTRTHLPFINP